MKAEVKIRILILGWHMLPYLIMYLAFRKIKNDMYATCDLAVLLLSVGGGWILMLSAVIIHPDPFALLTIPIVQLLAFLVLHGVIVVLRIFAPDEMEKRKRTKPEI